MPKYKIRVGITMGDPSGIGPYIIAAALSKLNGLAEFVVIGDRRVFERAQRALAYALNRHFIDLKNVEQRHFKFGQVRPEYGKASVEYLDRAMELIKAKAIDCIVTCPISKEAINLAGYKYSGHTEYFADKTGVKEPVMLLLNNCLKISLVTRHLSLACLPQAITEGKIYKTVLITQKALKQLFSLNRPRLAVCGLNPHASDNGLLGREENQVIKPALKRLTRAAGSKCVIDGPFPAEVAIARAAHGQYDCVIAMYHDQALIPLKLTGDESGVNITLGLPFIRTSPLHGTAFDLAANEFKDAQHGSLVAAIKLAVKCASNQKNA